MARTPLNTDEINAALHELPGWSFAGDALTKSFTFADFQEAVGFMVRLAFHAEALDHHPSLHNVYNRVEIALNTHDAGNKVTEMDVKLAKAIEALT